MEGSEIYSAEAVGARVRLLRQALDLKLSQFADENGFARNAVSNWETGRQRPSFRDAKVIVDRYGVTLDWLYFGRRHTLRYDVASLLAEKESE